MKGKVIKLGCSWLFIDAPSEIQIKCCTESEDFEAVVYVPISDSGKEQVCILRKGNNYGVYTLDHCDCDGGPGTWCNPMANPFPFDEVKYCSFPFDYDKEYGVFAFRIEKKWGIIKVVTDNNKEKGVYDVEYKSTKRKIVVPCKYTSIEDAELQLGEKFNWKDPFASDYL